MKQIHIDKLTEEPVSHNSAILKRVLLRTGEVPNITNFAISRFPIRESSPSHIHKDMSEVFFVISGSGDFIVDGVTYPVSKDCIVTILPYERHEIRNTGSDELVLLYFGVLV